LASRLVNLGRIVYMPAKVGNRRGYQVVAKSPDVSKEDEDFLYSYGVPVAVNPSDFLEGVRLMVLPSGRVGLNTLYNIGKGFDGRFGAIFSETLVLEKDAFVESNADFAAFADAFHAKAEAESLASEFGMADAVRSLNGEQRNAQESSGIDFQSITETVSDKTTLNTLLNAVLKGEKKVILVNQPQEAGGTSGKEFFPNLLLLFPPAMRVVPYTSYAAEPDREIPFQLMIATNGHYKQPSSPSLYDTIVVGDTARREDTPGTFNLADYLSTIVFERLTEELSELHRSFADLYGRVTDKSPTKLAALLEYAYKRDVFLNDEKLDLTQRFNLGLELAEQAPPGLSSELYEKLQSLAGGDPEKLAQFGLTYLQLSREQPSSFLRIFGEILGRLLDSNAPDTAFQFVKRANELSAELKGELLSRTTKELIASKNITLHLPLLRLVVESNQGDELVRSVKEQQRYSVVRPLCTILRTSSSQAEALALVDWVYRQAVQENPAVIQEVFEPRVGGSRILSDEDFWMISELSSRVKKELHVSGSRQPLLMVASGGIATGFLAAYGAVFVNGALTLEGIWLGALALSVIDYIYGLMKVFGFGLGRSKDTTAQSAPFAQDVFKTLRDYVDQLTQTTSGNKDLKRKASKLHKELERASGE